MWVDEFGNYSLRHFNIGDVVCFKADKNVKMIIVDESGINYYSGELCVDKVTCAVQYPNGEYSILQDISPCVLELYNSKQAQP